MIHERRNISWHEHASPYLRSCLAVENKYGFLIYNLQPADGPHWGKTPQRRACLLNWHTDL